MTDGSEEMISAQVDTEPEEEAMEEEETGEATWTITVCT